MRLLFDSLPTRYLALYLLPDARHLYLHLTDIV
jgi:hypothetical protein